MDFLLSSNLIVGFILIQPILDLVTSLAVRNMELPITLGLVRWKFLTKKFPDYMM